MHGPLRSRLACTGLFVLSALFVHAQGFTGYVTRPGTPQDFDVEGERVLCTPKTLLSTEQHATALCPDRRYGERLTIIGRFDRSAGALVAEKILPEASTADQTVHGFAVIDKILSPTILRADGYALAITSTTQRFWDDSLPNASAAATNQWIEYIGKRAANGSVELIAATFYAAGVTDREQSLRKKNEFNPASIKQDDKQSFGSKMIKGTDYKRIPAVTDPAQQARIDRIGLSLIPASQRDLPVADATRINFRFQLVDSKWKDCITLASGIVLVPHAVATLLTDDQLAAVLADNIAVALEKQTYRYAPAHAGMTASGWAAAAGGMLVPGLGIADLVATSTIGSRIDRRLHEQSGRISLVLLHDAGYDIEQAPIAWWRLLGNRDDYFKKPPPYRAAYLFDSLANFWPPSSPLLMPSPPSSGSSAPQ